MSAVMDRKHEGAVPKNRRPRRTDEIECRVGECPWCGDDLISTTDYIPFRGFVITWSCASQFRSDGACSYRKSI